MEITVRRVIRVVTLVIFLILITNLIIHPTTAIRSTQSEAELVSYVHSYDKYIPRWNNVYPPGDKINLYVSADEVNPNRAAAVDFVYVITDPKGYVIDAGQKEMHTIGYQETFFDVLEIDVKEDWVNGEYELDLYVYDVLNASGVFKDYTSLHRKAPYTGNAGVDVSTVDRENAPRIHKELEFTVSDSISPPKSQLLVYDSYLRAKELPEGVGNFLHLSVLNTIDHEGTGELQLLIDGEPVETKEVNLDGYEKTDINFQIPSLDLGVHTIEVIPKSDNIQLKETLPMFIEPQVYKGEIQIGDVYNGSVVYSPNNYVLGSIGVSAITDSKDVEGSIKVMKNKESAQKAMKMYTNTIAYLWSKNDRQGAISIGLLEGSDDRAEKILPELIDMVKRESDAPINYRGVLNRDEMDRASIVFYVNDKAPNVEEMEGFFEGGGFLIVDNTGFWSNPKSDLNRGLNSLDGDWTGFESEDDIYGAYYDLYIDKIITITTREEPSEAPTEFRISNLDVDKFIVDVDDPVNVSFTAMNQGKRGGEEVRVLINDEVVFEQTIDLDIGQEETISFQYTPEKEGSYKIIIEDTQLSKVFFAKKATEEQETPTATPTKEDTGRQGGVELIIGSAVLLAALVVVRLFMRE
ncbi:MAG: hypothetical protein R6U44_09355 [Archaeoglobaceae archaeon]